MDNIPEHGSGSTLPPISPQRLLQAILRKDLGAFTERCFGEIASGQAYEHNWHLEALSHHLSEVSNGNIKRLLITVQPRSLKSLSASIALPAWILGHDPCKRIVCVSYANDLAIAHANSFRNVINSLWYNALFPAMRIDPKKDTETEVRTTMGGYRLTTTVGGSLTGRGGSIIIIDDPMKAADAYSEAARTKVNTWFDETLISRLDNKKSDAIIIVMQRLHVNDLADHVLKAGGWTHLDLPAISDYETRIQIGPDTFHNRPADDVLQPIHEPRAVLDQLKTTMGSAAFSAQYQQQPVPTGGNMIKWKQFTPYNHLPEPHYSDRIVQSWDTATKSNDLADYSVGITALVSRGEIHIIDVVRKRLDYPALKKRVILEKKRHKTDTILIEDKGSGSGLIQDLRAGHIHTIPIIPEGDKIVRMSNCSAKIEAGTVFIPIQAPWLDDFRNEPLAFPHGSHDDQVDALSQLINWTRTKSTYTLDNIG